ncbi:MAG: DUF2007 domain-containing protein [Anaerolineales bacterium]|uniref:putative signal transducing protein n=1 Tax=Candidatus Villigracilis affinis TaxID=3140682 RepID=UPI001DE7E36A|nr:DUF2007 domain-containing protein [Anaerolineales bacterium]MBK9600923.1 DUF2007 domain-containing protein [Anaerolineales bacterium]MBL0345338.1 DUF2007 domain-containing protein [Anaerolineales bacterium]
MDKLKYEKIGEANSRAEADVIESFLEAEGIDVELIEESVSYTSYAVPLVRIQIFVPIEKFEQARELLKSFDDILPKEDDEE